MKNKKKVLMLSILMIVLLVGAGILYNGLKDKAPNTEQIPEKPSVQENATAENETQKLTPAMNFTVVDRDGKEVNLDDFKGKPIVLNFWASWCGPCKSEMPAFQSAYEKYGDDIHFLMVNLTDNQRETVETAKKFVDEQGYNFPVYFDIKQEAARKYQVYAVPVTYFIDAEGNLEAAARSAIDAATLQRGIDMIYKGA